MSNENGAMWIEEYDENPSICGLKFCDPDGVTTGVGLTRAGVDVLIELLINWAEYSDERMNELFADLLGSAE